MPSAASVLVAVAACCLLAAAQAIHGPSEPVWASTNRDVFNTLWAKAPEAPSASWNIALNASVAHPGLQAVEGAAAATSQGTIVMVLASHPLNSTQGLIVVALDGSTGQTLWSSELPKMKQKVLSKTNVPVLLVDKNDDIFVVLATPSADSTSFIPVVAALDYLTGDILYVISGSYPSLSYPNNGCGLTAAFDAYNKLYIVVPGKYGVLNYDEPTSPSLETHTLSSDLVPCGTVASIYPGILLLSGSVVTAVDLKTNSVMYTSPSELSALTGAVLTTNSEVVLRSNAVSCGFPTHVCAPASVMTVSLSTGDAMSVYNFTHGVNENLLFDSNDGILVLNQETSSFSHKNYLVGLDVSYGSGRTQFNQSIPTNFGVGETVALAYREIVEDNDQESPTFIAALSYSTRLDQQQPYNPTIRFIHPVSGQLITKAALPANPFTFETAQLQKFFIVNNNVIAIIQYSSITLEKSTQVVSIPYTGSQM